MSCFDIFFALETTSSEVNKVTLFGSRYTKYIPDIFFILCFGTLFFAAQTLDKIYIYLIVFYREPITTVFLIGTFVIFPLAFSICLEQSDDSFFPVCFAKNWLFILSIITGVGPFLISAKILSNMLHRKSDLNIQAACYSFPVFHMSKKDMSFVKMYYLFNAIVKCIPQIYIIIGLMLGKCLTGTLAILGQVSIVLNLVMFSLTMALTFPLRSRPRVYTDSIWVLLNAFCKFMAAICGWGVNLLMITILFSSIGYYSFLVHFVRLFFWIWPSWYILRKQPQFLDRFCLSFYLFFFTLIFNIMYIHPFEGRGKLLYYFFYLFKFLTEVFSIYIFTTAQLDIIITYFTLKSVMMGYLCCYGLVNILHKYKNDKSGCVYFENGEEKVSDGKGNDEKDKDGSVSKVETRGVSKVETRASTSAPKNSESDKKDEETQTLFDGEKENVPKPKHKIGKPAPLKRAK